MSDELEPGDPLDRLVRALRQPVAIAPGLASRVGERSRRRHKARIAGSLTLVLLIGLIGAAMHARVPGTPVTFAITAPSVRSIALVGDFTDWRSDRVQLERTGPSVWQATVKLRPGRYRFAYLVDHEQWRADTRAASAPDDFGRPTSVLTVVGN
jgi:Glycogen recognition site of AMP-activated protein kinase